MIARKSNPLKATKRKLKKVVRHVAPFLFKKHAAVSHSKVHGATILKKRAHHATEYADGAASERSEPEVKLISKRRAARLWRDHQVAKSIFIVPIRRKKHAHVAKHMIRKAEEEVAIPEVMEEVSQAAVENIAQADEGGALSEGSVDQNPSPENVGGFVLEEKEAKRPKPAMNVEELVEEEGFMRRVRRGINSGAGPILSQSPWQLLKMRFGSSKSASQPAPQAPVSTISAEDLKGDAFLQAVGKSEKEIEDALALTGGDKKIESGIMFGKEDVESPQSKKEIQGDLDSALEALAGDDEIARRPQSDASHAPQKAGTLSLEQIRQEAAEAKKAADSLRKEMLAEQKEREKHRVKEEVKADVDSEDAKNAAEEKKKEQEVKAEAKKVAAKKKAAAAAKHGFMQKLSASIAHVGLGKERMSFVQNMGTMLDAGLPIIDALRTLQLETRTKPMKKVIGSILDMVENGIPLWRAMDQQDFFSLHAIALVRIGEEAGNLAENFQYLAQQEEKDHELKGKVKMAMIYPSIVMTLMFIIVMGLGMFVLPQLIGVLFSLNVELPFITRMVIAFTNAFTEYGTIVVPGMLGGAVLFIILAKFTRLKILTQWVLFRIPGIGKLAKEATIARFGVILGGLLRAGVPVMEAMQSLIEVTPILSYRRLYEKMYEHIAVGDSFAKSFGGIKGSNKLLPPSVQQLIITGEKSGALANIMLKVADIYDKKASETAQKLPVILEPMLLLFIGGLVGTIAFAIIVPIYSIVGSVGR